MEAHNVSASQAEPASSAEQHADSAAAAALAGEVQLVRDVITALGEVARLSHLRPRSPGGVWEQQMAVPIFFFASFVGSCYGPDKCKLQPGETVFKLQCRISNLAHSCLVRADKVGTDQTIQTGSDEG